MYSDDALGKQGGFYEIDDLGSAKALNTFRVHRGSGRHAGNGVVNTVADRERAAALAAADAVLILVYDRDGRRQGEIGRRREHKEHYDRRVKQGFVVVVKAASERVKYWVSEARRVCRAKTPIEWLDGTGIAAVVDGGVQ